MTDQDPAPTALRDRFAAAIASYDRAVGQATDPAPSGHHYGQADAVLAVRDRELEQARAVVERVRALHQPIDCAEFACDCHACCAVCRWTLSQESGSQPQWGSVDPHVYPCPTIRALDPQEQS